MQDHWVLGLGFRAWVFGFRSEGLRDELLDRAVTTAGNQRILGGRFAIRKVFAHEGFGKDVGVDGFILCAHTSVGLPERRVDDGGTVCRIGVVAHSGGSSAAIFRSRGDVDAGVSAGGYYESSGE